YKYRDTLNKLSDTFETVDCILDSKMESDTAESYPTGETIINKMNLTGYNSLMGHGDPATIACSGRGGKYNEWEFIKALNSYKYDIDSAKRQINLSKPCYNNGLDLLCNYDSPSVIYTMSCTTMPFDVYSESGHIFDLPHTMASSFTVGGSFGGVAYIGNTRSGYWGTSPLLEVRFLQQLKNQVKIGIAEALSKYNFMSDNEVLHTHNLIGDPEFELWKGKPLEREVFVSWNDKEVAVDGEDVVGSTVVINNGEGYFHSHTVKKSLGFVYSGGGKMEAVGVYKTGYLPMVKLDCYDDQLEDCTKKFAVRSSELGCHESKSVSIGSDAEVDIRAVDSIETGSGLSIANDGELILRCDKEVSLNGSSVNNGGSLTVKGEKVILSNGFSVKAGGSLSINDI
ncbi:MAG: hypothetical protein K2I08_03465, partial [Muribaculaceae bacterium]|nr:hypothetical protein [Muribaculaceae bacterium]